MDSIKTNICFTCIIPVYNEKERIGRVLDQMVRVKNLSKIICVDSASTDGSADFVKQNCPQVELVRMAKTLFLVI